MGRYCISDPRHLVDIYNGIWVSLPYPSTVLCPFFFFKLISGYLYITTPTLLFVCEYACVRARAHTHTPYIHPQTEGFHLISYLHLTLLSISICHVVIIRWLMRNRIFQNSIMAWETEQLKMDGFCSPSKKIIVVVKVCCINKRFM